MCSKLVAFFVASGVLATPACSRGAEAQRESPAGSSAPVVETEPSTSRYLTKAAPAPSAGPYRFLVIGGGPTPESNEVSLEQDIDLVRRALPAPGLLLFAGGSESASVRELRPNVWGDPLLLALGDLFAPRPGRQSRYRAPRFSAERATLENVEARLSAELAQSDGGALLVYVAAHGDQGADAKSNSIALWGGGALTAARLAELHERHRRPLKLVATSCFSGGFAELAFARADAASRRPPSTPRCGLFAGTADRETSGCDPNPDRREQESYGLHFVHALAGTRKDGSALPPGAADFDGDGAIGLLDAHTWARIEALSFDVPTTTSERWLESTAPGSGPIDRSVSPENGAVVDRLGAALGLATEQAVKRRYRELHAQLADLHRALDAAEDELSALDAAHGALVLGRWPVLDDPFHPDFAATLDRDRDSIEGALANSAEAKARALAKEKTAALYERLSRILVDEARVLRLQRAYATLHEASALMRKGGPAAAQYQKLLACERAAP